MRHMFFFGIDFYIGTINDERSGLKLSHVPSKLIVTHSISMLFSMLFNVLSSNAYTHCYNYQFITKDSLLIRLP